ncbi:phospholipase D family protein [Paracoccus mangrovi]|uniref:Phospholipase D family protein n=1 Tax=Paracoccus mangrovi TaxID=1715645 RepID=A0ABV7RBP3_9RHOB
MSRFLATTDIDGGSSPCIKRILSGEEVRIASAFLGRGAETAVPPDARLICDIGMGGTSPLALKALSEKLGAKLKYLRDFHAKVYLSDQGCVIGSANLSSRGVGFLSQAKLIEAAVFVEADDPIAETAGKWFEDLWSKAQVVGPKELEWAEATWRVKGGTPEGRRNYKTLVDALHDPDSPAQEWRYIVTREEMPDGVKEWAEAQESEVASKAEWDLTGDFDHFSELQAPDEFEKGRQKHYISLHRDTNGKLHLSALRFLGNQDASGTGTGTDLGETVTVSFFAKLDWKTSIGLPRLSRATLGSESKLSAAIRKTREDLFGRALTSEEFLRLLSKG